MTFTQNVRSAVALLAAAGLVAASPAKAVITPELTFTMPQGVDPVSLFFSFDGQFFNVPGSALLSPNFGGAGGVDVHSAIGNPIQFSRLIVRSSFTGNVKVIRKTAVAAFPKWSGPTSVFFPSNRLDLKTQLGSAKIGQSISQLGGGRAFGLLVVNAIDPSLVGSFSAANFKIKAKVNHAPEPGTVALLGAGMLGALCLLRKRRAS